MHAADLSSPVVRHAQPHTEYGEVELNRFGVASVSRAVQGRTRKEGFANEIRHVRTGTGQDDLWWDAVWYKEFARFGVTVWKICKGFGRWLWNLVRMKPTPLFDRTPLVPDYDVHSEGSDEDEADELVRDVYEKFTREEIISDDDEDYRPPSASRTTSDDDGSNSEEDEEPASDTVKLYADLTEASSSRAAPVLIAHMTNTTPSPLTRRKYRHLMGPSKRLDFTRSPSPPDLEWLETQRQAWLASKSTQRRREVDDESRRNCVICTVEPRQIICWPCRCLALCDDCRENLASRSSASKHTCPCCRRLVEGYSRIFVP